MTIDAPAGVAVVDTAANRDQSSYVDWPAIIAGIVLASAISLGRRRPKSGAVIELSGLSTSK